MQEEGLLQEWFGIISWFLFLFSKVLMVCSLFDLQHASFLSFLLFSLLDLDFSFLWFSTGHILQKFNPLAAHH